MGWLDFLKGPDINQGVKDCQETPGAVLLDVRTPEEYRQGHIPGSKNLPLQDIGANCGLPEDRSAPLFVYCHSGARSHQAADLMKRMGYTGVINIGGIVSYSGAIER